MATSLAVLLSAAGTAVAVDPPARVDHVRAETASLAESAHRALLQLYSLETRLRGAESRLAALEARAARVEEQQATARDRLAIARRDVGKAEQRLASRVRTLYVEGDVDPLAVLLGAESFDEALAAFDGLGRLAADDRAVVAAVKESRSHLREAVGELAARQAELRDLVAQARANRDALSSARSERVSYLAGLRRRQTFNGRLIDRLLAEAAAAEAKTEEIAPATTATTSAAPAPAPSPSGGTRMIVSSTGYCLRGPTATGMQAGPGTVAVDPAVIPLGTQMFVPGYGPGVAADTGAAVRGRVIDLWFSSCPKALQWGRRTVTITLR